MKINPLLLKVGSEKEKKHTKNAGERWLKCTSILLWELGLDFFLKYKVSPPVINGVK